MGNEHDAWVTIRRFDDSVEAEIAQQFLRDHGIPVSVLGNSGATSVLNRFTTVLDIRLTVPEERLEEAKEALEALVAPLPDHPFRGKMPGEDSEALVKKKSAAAAFILACLVPIGGGHFYAQHTAAGTVLATGIVGGYIGAIVGARPVLFAAAGLLVAIDAVGAIFAVKRSISGEIPSDRAQRFAALVAVIVAFGIAAAVER